MSETIFSTTTGKDGGIEIPRTGLAPGTKVLVRVEMADAVERHGLKPYQRVHFSRRLRFSGDPVPIQQEMRREWGR